MTCWVDDELSQEERFRVRSSVCSNLNVKFYHNDGKSYCDLHWPGQDKNIINLVDSLIQSGQTDFSYSIFNQSFNLNNQRIKSVFKLDGATFLSDVHLERLRFDSGLSIRKVRFRSTFSMNKVLLNGQFDLYSTHFSGMARINRFRFRSTVMFRDCDFAGGTSLSFGRFRDQLAMMNCSFGGSKKGSLFLDKCYFLGLASIAECDLEHGMVISYSSFRSHVNFIRTRFAGYSRITETPFARQLHLQNTNFEAGSRMTFEACPFEAEVLLDDAKLGGYFQIIGSRTSRDIPNPHQELPCTAVPRMHQASRDIHVDCFPNDESMLSLRRTQIDEPEHVWFESVRLQPHWFVGSDLRKIHFHNVSWKSSNGEPISLLNERARVASRLSSKPQLLTIALRQLAENSEENRHFSDASLMRSLAFESDRLDSIESRENMRRTLYGSLRKDLKWGSVPATTVDFVRQAHSYFRHRPGTFLSSIYRLLSGYGERWERAAFWLFFFVLLFGSLLWQFGTFEHLGGNVQLGATESFLYVIQAMLFQRPEPRTADSLTRAIYVLASIFGPLQAALTALAIRRRFMR